MKSNEQIIEEMNKEIELLKKTVELQRLTIDRLLNAYVLNKNVRRVKNHLSENESK